MAEVLVQFNTVVRGSDGRGYVARVCGREAENRLWEGWIEFDRQDGSPVLRTARETEQPNRTDLEYWATGLTATYLEGALERALRPQAPELRPRSVAAEPSFDRPASRPPEVGSSVAADGIPTRVVLDPFEVYVQGEDVLRRELGALDEGHLRNIVRAYQLIGEGELDLQALQHATLVDSIVAAVRARAT
jgi:hypothetical protein